MPRTLPLALLVAALLLPASSALAAKTGYRAEIRRTTGGVPHIKAQGLRLARLRLRLRLRAGPAVRVRRHHRHGQRAALALLRHHRRLAQRRHEPAVGLLLAADPRRAHRRAADQAQGAARPGQEGARHRQGLRGGLQRLPAQDRPRQAAGPDLPRQGVGAPDHGDGRLPPLLPARPARELGQLPEGDRQRRPALGRRGGARRVGADRGAVPAGGSRATPCSARDHRSAPTPTASAPTARATAARSCSATRTSRGRAPSAGTRCTSRSPARSTRSAPACRACRSSTSASTSTSPGATRSRPRAASRPTSSSSRRATRAATWSTARP